MASRLRTCPWRWSVHRPGWRPSARLNRALCACFSSTDDPQVIQIGDLSEWISATADAPEPVVVHKDAVVKWWPIFKCVTDSDWTTWLSRIGEHFGEHTVPVEIGDSYLAVQKARIPFALYCSFLSQAHTSAQPPSTPVYLAQHAIFEQIPELDHFICGAGNSPLHSFFQACDLVQKNVWLGPADTLSPLHTDPHHNILTQCFGTKTVFLISPGHSEWIPVSKNPLQKNTCEIVDADMHPHFDNIPSMSVTLSPGDSLFIPQGWWHLARAGSGSSSLSVNQWWCPG